MNTEQKAASAARAARIFAFVLVWLAAAFALLEAVFFCSLLGFGSFDPVGIAAFLYYMVFLVPPLLYGLLNLIAAILLAAGGQGSVFDRAWYFAAVGLYAADVGVLFVAMSGLFDAKDAFTVLLVSSVILHLLLGLFSVYETEKDLRSRKKQNQTD